MVSAAFKEFLDSLSDGNKCHNFTKSFTLGICEKMDKYLRSLNDREDKMIKSVGWEI
jgi:hypothetical protein